MAGAVAIVETTIRVAPVNTTQGGLTGSTAGSAPQPVRGSAGSELASPKPVKASSPVAVMEAGAGSDRVSVDDTVGSVATSLVPPTLSGDGMSVDLALADSFQVAKSSDAPGGSGGAPASLMTSDTRGGGAIDQSSSSSGAVADVSPGSQGESPSPSMESNESSGLESSAAESLESTDAAGAAEGSEAETSAAGEAETSEPGDGESTETTTEEASKERADESSDEASRKQAADQGGAEDQKSAPSPAVAVKRVDAGQAVQAVSQGDALATDRTVGALNLPELSGRRTPSAGEISGYLQQLQRQVSQGSKP